MCVSKCRFNAWLLENDLLQISQVFCADSLRFFIKNSSSDFPEMSISSKRKPPYGFSSVCVRSDVCADSRVRKTKQLLESNSYFLVKILESNKFEEFLNFLAFSEIFRNCLVHRFFLECSNSRKFKNANENT